MPVYQLGNGNDDFKSWNQPDWASNSAVFGGNGDDTLISLGGGSGMGPGATLTGGLGRDAFIPESDTGNLVAPTTPRAMASCPTRTRSKAPWT